MEGFHLVSSFNKFGEYLTLTEYLRFRFFKSVFVGWGENKFCG